MTNVLVKIIPLDLASALSPGILALIIVLLASKNHSKAHIFGFFLGSLLVAIGIALFGFTIGNNFDTDVNPTLSSAIIDFVLGIFFIFYGLKLFFSKEKERNLDEKEDKLKIFKWFAIGLLISITNFDAVLLSFASAKIVGDAEIDSFAKWILLIINVLFFILPITLPILLKIIFPKIAESVLTKLNVFLKKYAKYIILIMFLVFGLWFMWKGIKYFI